MTKLTEAQRKAWEWLSFDNEWRPSAFYAATMNALVRRGFVAKRYGRDNVVEYRALPAGRAALQRT